MFGVIVGVASVVTTVSLGEGVKQQLRQQGAHRGADLLTILPGQRVERNQAGTITRTYPFANDSAVFTEADYRAVQSVKAINRVAPLARVTGLAETDKREYAAHILATSGALPALLNQKIAYGSFFSDQELDEGLAVIGPRVAERLFGENVPIGKSFRIRQHDFVVRGVFEPFAGSSLAPLETDYNDAIFIPYDVGREIMGGTLLIQQVLAKPQEAARTAEVVAATHKALLELHAGQEDFTVLTQAETLLATSDLLNLLTALIAGVAAISLFVGGIGIMNIMFVSVSERTAEIGVRKAVGATNGQILSQFLTEALILGGVGGVIGVLLSILVNFLLRVLTDLQPVITLPIIGLAVLVAVGVGVIFGVTPALRAARKDPVDALRYE